MFDLNWLSNTFYKMTSKFYFCVLAQIYNQLNKNDIMYIQVIYTDQDIAGMTP